MWSDEPPREPAEWTPAPVLPDDLAPAAGEVELVADIWSADARAARQHALLTLAVARLARRRRRERLASPTGRGGPGVDTRATRSPVLADVDEAFTAELALIRCCTEGEAGQLAVESVLLCGRLAATWAELYAGRITVAKARALVDLLGAAAADVAHRVEQLVLPNAEHRDVAWLRRAVRRHLVRLDAGALEHRRSEAKQRRDVFRQPTGDGMSELVIIQTTGKAAAMAQTLDAYARMLRRDGDERPIGVLRSEVAFDLITRPWDTSRPPVTAVLSIHAGLDALRAPAPGPDGARLPQPACEVDGTPVTAAECRALLTELDMLGIDSAPAGGRVQVAVGDPATGRLHAVATRNELRTAAGRRRTRRRGSAPPGGPVGTSGARADGPGLGPPPATAAYQPSAAQRRFVTVRDQHCRMPGCHRRPGRLDIDHAIAHADGGTTDCENLCCLCRRHHRIKTHARGWRFQLLPDGRLLVRTPSGVTRATAPPGFFLGDAPDPPWREEEVPPDLLAG